MVTLYPHQQQALDETGGMTHVAYYHDMGLGKTFTGSEKMMQLGARVNLIVCQKSKIDDWLNHIRANYSGKIFALYDLTNGVAFHEFLQTALVYDYISVVGIINYDLVWRRKDLLQL